MYVGSQFDPLASHIDLLVSTAHEMQFALFTQKRCIASLIGFGTLPEVRGGKAVNTFL